MYLYTAQRSIQSHIGGWEKRSRGPGVSWVKAPVDTLTHTHTVRSPVFRLAARVCGLSSTDCARATGLDARVCSEQSAVESNRALSVIYTCYTYNTHRYFSLSIFRLDDRSAVGREVGLKIGCRSLFWQVVRQTEKRINGGPVNLRRESLLSNVSADRWYETIFFCYFWSGIFVRDAVLASKLWRNVFPEFHGKLPRCRAAWNCRRNLDNFGAFGRRFLIIIIIRN